GAAAFPRLSSSTRRVGSSPRATGSSPGRTRASRTSSATWSATGRSPPSGEPAHGGAERSRRPRLTVSTVKTLVDVATFLGRLVGKTRVKTLPVKEHSDSARRAATSRVPFLLTLDLHTRLELPRELDACLDHLAQADIRATFFTPAVLARNALVKEGLRRCVRDGHQLACHGLLHRAPEDFVHDPLEV